LRASLTRPSPKIKLCKGFDFSKSFGQKLAKVLAFEFKIQLSIYAQKLIVTLLFHKNCKFITQNWLHTSA
jgi:hypothetical protein